MVSRTTGMRVPTASHRTISPTNPRLLMSANVMATTPAGLSGAAPASVNTQPVVYSPAPTMSTSTGGMVAREEVAPTRPALCGEPLRCRARKEKYRDNCRRHSAVSLHCPGRGRSTELSRVFFAGVTSQRRTRNRPRRIFFHAGGRAAGQKMTRPGFSGISRFFSY